MSGKQRAVMWIGLILVALNLIRKKSEIVSVIFSGAGATTPADPGQSSSSGSRPSIQIPIDPVLPTGPKITVPIPTL